ncbi:MAG: D-alanine--D-alanine ligase family protein [Mycobacteriales bacterium]
MANPRVANPRVANPVDCVAVVYGGPSPEHDISILTGLQCERLLAGTGLKVACIYWTRGGEWVLAPGSGEAADYLDGAPRGAEPLEVTLGTEPGLFRRAALGRRARVEVSAALLCLHGGAGESGTVQGLLELIGVPYTGTGPAGSALGMDKLAFAGVVAGAGLPAAPRVALTRELAEVAFPGPYLVKPRYGGSSIGIERVADLGTARDLAASSPFLRAGAVLEPFLDGAVDLNLAVITYPELRSSLLERPLREPAGEAFYSYQEKYLQGHGLVEAPRELPAAVPAEVTAEAERLARVVAELVPLAGLPRIDFLWHAGRLLVNEVNTIPGAMGLYLWPGEVAPEQLLLDMLEEARRRPTPAGGGATFQPGAALRAAAGISGKLARLRSPGG